MCIRDSCNIVHGGKGIHVGHPGVIARTVHHHIDTAEKNDSHEDIFIPLGKIFLPLWNLIFFEGWKCKKYQSHSKTDMDGTHDKGAIGASDHYPKLEHDPNQCPDRSWITERFYVFIFFHNLRCV